MINHFSRNYITKPQAPSALGPKTTTTTATTKRETPITKPKAPAGKEKPQKEPEPNKQIEQDETEGQQQEGAPIQHVAILLERKLIWFMIEKKMPQLAELQTGRKMLIPSSN